jgi:hypothetical protein
VCTRNSNKTNRVSKICREGSRRVKKVSGFYDVNRGFCRQKWKEEQERKEVNWVFHKGCFRRVWERAVFLAQLPFLITEK